MASIAGPDASASRQPRDPHAHRRPFGSTTVWPTWPALPVAPSSSLPFNTIPPSTVVDTTIARKSERPWAAPSQPSARANALAPRSPYTLRLVAEASWARSGNDLHAPMVDGDTATTSGRTGPAHPTPTA